MPINIIPVAFGTHRKATAPPINYQYDISQILKINGLALPEFYEVDFCNTGDSQTITMIGNAEGVQIPDQFLSTGKPVKAYIVLTESESVQTRYEITIPVSHRPSRSDIEPTPAEQQQIDTLISNLTDASEAATASATAAETARDRAEAAAQSAAVSASDAKYAANTSEGLALLNLASIARPAPTTERVADGTKIRLPLLAPRLVVNLGWYLSGSTLAIYNFYGTDLLPGQTEETYLLRDQTGVATQYELTYENAPKINKFNTTKYYRHKLNLTISADPTVFDMRICRLIFDANHNEIDRIYSAQYRFVVTGGNVTRTRFATASTSAQDIVDIGLFKEVSTGFSSINIIERGDIADLIPLVSTNQGAGFEFIIPDAYFADAPYGLSLVVFNGEGTISKGPVFFKAENAVTLFSPNGTEYKVTVANDGTLTATAAT